MIRVTAAALLLLAGLLWTAPARAEAKTHVVAPGETLWVIAREQLGNGTFWPALYLANRDQIKDPSRVYPGQALVVPELDAAAREALMREAADLGIH